MKMHDKPVTLQGNLKENKTKQKNQNILSV